MKRWLFPIVLVLGIALLGGCIGDDATSKTVTTSGSWARPESQGNNSAAYMVIHNDRSEAVRLIGASGDVARMVEIHQSSADSSGMMHMAKVDGIDIPTGSDVELKPGGYHVMLMGLQRNLSLGDHFTLTLKFDQGADLDVDVVVANQQP
jgi:copper(I)-binding protein